MSPTYSYNIVNFGLLAAEIISLVWGTPSYFNGFASWQHYCTAVNYWASAKLCGVEQRAPSMFGRAAITLGIGPHSSSIFLLFLFARLISAVGDWMSTILPHMVRP